ncbi:MAG: hypothetical protein V9G08_04325 [Dermatophilaceae bacterium]
MTSPIVAVYGRTDSGHWQLGGFARLELPRMLQAEADLEAAVGAHPEVSTWLAHLSWLDEQNHPRAELVEVLRMGPIASWQGSPGGLGLELAEPSTAPPLHQPPTPGSDGFWCVLFPWASFCGGD